MMADEKNRAACFQLPQFLTTFTLSKINKNNNDMENRSLVTIAEHSKEKILYMLEMAKQFEERPNRHLLDGKVVATLFFEPSTRTRLSFETAANRLGARVIGFSDPKATSSSKGETLKDTIKMVSNYADIIVMRHYLEGAARYASEVPSSTPETVPISILRKPCSTSTPSTRHRARWRT